MSTSYPKTMSDAVLDTSKIYNLPGEYEIRLCVTINATTKITKVKFNWETA